MNCSVIQKLLQRIATFRFRLWRIRVVSVFGSTVILMGKEITRHEKTGLHF